MNLEMPKYIKSEKFGEIRGFLRVEEARFIAEEGLKVTNYIDREIIVNILLVKTLTEYELDLSEDIDYDLLYHSGLISKLQSVSGVELIWDYIYDYESMNKQIQRTLEKLGDALEKLPNQKELGKLIDKTLKKIEKIKSGK